MSAQILLVETDSPRRTEHAEALGGEVTLAGDSQEALRQAAERQFDLVVADLVLPKPGLSGADTLNRVGELSPGARTILFTEHTGLTGLLEGMSDVFLPSAEPEAFLTGLRHAVARLLGQAPLPEAPQEEATTQVMPRTFETLEGRPRPKAAGGSEKSPRPGLFAKKYRFVRELGRGGMGIVYQAEDTFIGRPVAVKLLHLRAAASARADLERRMRREIMIAGRLDHPNIVTVYDAAIENDEIFIVMELVEGRTLRQILRDRGPLERGAAIDVLLQTLEAVRYAHEKGIVHRDLKPENILLTPDGKVKVVDFGLAKLMSFASSASFMSPPSDVLEYTSEGAVVGTMAYMAPEQMIGLEVDHRADVYALGAVLFEIVDGRLLMSLLPPLTRAAMLSLRGEAVEIPAVRGEPRLTRIVRRALAIHPEERYRDAAAFSEALMSPDDAPAVTGWRRFLPWSWRP